MAFLWVIFLIIRKQSKCSCHKMYNQSLHLIKTLLQQQRNTGLFHTAKWNLHILVYNSILTVPFLEKNLLSFTDCLRLFLGWCHYSGLHTTRSNLNLHNTKSWPSFSVTPACIWQHSWSTDLTQTASKSQHSKLCSVKSHHCSHSVFGLKRKKEPWLVWTTSRHSFHPDFFF